VSKYELLRTRFLSLKTEVHERESDIDRIPEPAIKPAITYVEVLPVIERECLNTNQSSDGFVHSVYAPSVIKRTR